MQAKWSLAIILGALSLQAIASPVASNNTKKIANPESPFSVDRLSEANVITERAKVNNNGMGSSITLNEGALLSQEVKKWAVTQNYKLLWGSDKDYIIYREVKFNGKSNEDILRSLGELFSSEQYGLVVKLYTGNNVLVIDSQ
ncbi:TcpQ domain-containing protein [[Enterobacter] lignolyticus]|uniref:Type IV pilus biogenesis protein n=1 Tax=Enterobacter lignolyticus (strain SCF1) TaxID=701347 RepID=E3G6F5_ENTLS|nr:TcpQ domain-containing protein [[Enterobacter] lignolyticus]ADO47278.1 putative type IV pilus biogenesis protein [[Enterobacter] lignolyticus SCF1]